MRRRQRAAIATAGHVADRGPAASAARRFGMAIPLAARADARADAGRFTRATRAARRPSPEPAAAAASPAASSSAASAARAPLGPRITVASLGSSATTGVAQRRPGRRALRHVGRQASSVFVGRRAHHHSSSSGHRYLVGAARFLARHHVFARPAVRSAAFGRLPASDDRLRVVFFAHGAPDVPPRNAAMMIRARARRDRGLRRDPARSFATPALPQSMGAHMWRSGWPAQTARKRSPRKTLPANVAARRRLEQPERLAAGEQHVVVRGGRRVELDLDHHAALDALVVRMDVLHLAVDRRP